LGSGSIDIVCVASELYKYYSVFTDFWTKFFWIWSQKLLDVGVGTGAKKFRCPEQVSKSLDARSRCQAKFLTSAKFLTFYCLSVLFLLRVKEQGVAITFLMCAV